MSVVTSEAEVLEILAGLIREVIGQAWAEDVEIGMATSFGEDLELESIEFVALAEKLTARFGRKVDFAAWLSEMRLEEILGLTVGQVVEFIARCLSSTETA